MMVFPALPGRAASIVFSILKFCRIGRVGRVPGARPARESGQGPRSGRKVGVEFLKGSIFCVFS